MRDETKMLHNIIKYTITGKFGKFKFEQRKVNLSGNFENIDLYLHVPFCERTCPYCPYNKCDYDARKAAEYIKALKKEIELYKPYLADANITSIYVGGGTPTLLLNEMGDILNGIKNNFKLSSHFNIGVEAHPADVNNKTLSFLREAGVDMLSIGIQTFNNRLLKFLGRNYDGNLAQIAIAEASAMGFKCVNVDLIWDIPTQTLEELKTDIEKTIELKAGQISFYPLMLFRYTKMGKEFEHKRIFNSTKERRMYNLIRSMCLTAGYKQSSIWTFNSKDSLRYSSVTRERYLGLGAGSVSLFDKYFFVNTFWVDEYIKSLENNTLPVALSAELSAKEQAAYWLFWRFYDTSINGSRFIELFDTDTTKAFSLSLKILRILGLMEKSGDSFNLTDKGLWWFHKMEKAYSYKYLAKIWEECLKQPWPETVEI